jgi:hypothetical protein
VTVAHPYYSGTGTARGRKALLDRFGEFVVEFDES